MKYRATVAAFMTAAAALVCQSCAVPSVFAVAPKAPPANVEWAKGEWNSKTDQPNTKNPETFTASVEPIGGGSYLVTFPSTLSAEAAAAGAQQLQLVARPFELGGRLFADVTLQQSVEIELAKKYPALVIFTHVLARIDRDAAGNATLALPVYTKAKELAEQQKRALPMVMSEANDGVALALAGDSESVTKFYEANAGNDELFALKMKWVKAKPAQ